MPSLSRHTRLCIRKAAFCTVFYTFGGAFLLGRDSLKAFASSALLIGVIALPWLSIVYTLGGRLQTKFSSFESRKRTDKEISESMKLQIFYLGRLIVGIVLSIVSITFSRFVFAIPLFLAYAVIHFSTH